MFGSILSRRWASPDLFDFVRRGLANTAPQPDPDEGQQIGTPLDTLYTDAHNLGVEVLDLRGLNRGVHYDPKEWGWFRDDLPKKNVPVRGKAKGLRDWSKVTAIMLHTTAVDMGPKRFLGVPVQCGIADDSTIVLCHPNNAKTWHGNAANGFTVGVEISGHSDAGELQVQAARALVKYIHADVQQHHEHRMAMMAHRQTHGRKPNDPGPQIWNDVAVPMMAALGMVVGPTLGKGRDIPDDPDADWRRVL